MQTPFATKLLHQNLAIILRQLSYCNISFILSGPARLANDECRTEMYLREKRVAKSKCCLGRESWSSGYGEMTHVRKVVGSNPSAAYWMDITLIHV